jgi:DNA polymerase (family X)
MGLFDNAGANAEIAAMFDQAAELLEIQGENQFRVRAYRRAARVVEGLPQSVRSMLSAGRDLSEFPGIGKDLAGKIADIVKTGHFVLLDTLKQKLPGELGDMAALPGLGPKRVKLIYDKLKVRTLDDLRHVLKSGRLRELKGFGPTIAQKPSEALEKPREEKRFKPSVAEPEAEALVSFLRDSGRIVVAGSYRRRRDTIGDLDVLVTAKDGSAVGDKLVRYENVAEVLAHGSARTAVILRSGMQVDLRAVPEESYGAALLYFTGSKAHNIALRALAIEYDWKLNEYGLFAGKRRIAGASEEEVYKKLGLAFIPPELREDRGEVALAKANKLPHLITLSDIRGDLHVHSDWTDGTTMVEAMAEGARVLGHAYIAPPDHSRRVAMAHGLDPARLSRQIKEVDRLNDRLAGITILKGINYPTPHGSPPTRWDTITVGHARHLAAKYSLKISKAVAVLQHNDPNQINGLPDALLKGPAAESRAQVLPFGELSWQNFERLRLTGTDGEPSTAGCMAPLVKTHPSPTELPWSHALDCCMLRRLS